MMKKLLILMLFVPLLTTGCATRAVRSLGRTTIYDGPVGAIITTNGDIGIKDVRYEITEPKEHEDIVTQRYYWVTQADIASRTNNITRQGYIGIDYHLFLVSNSTARARLIEDTLTSSGPSIRHGTDEVTQVWKLSKGFGGFHPLEYSLQGARVKLAMGPQFSHEAGIYRKTWGKIMQPLLIPAVAIDIITSPIQVFFWIHEVNKGLKNWT
jgi:hypothetical protein